MTVSISHRRVIDGRTYGFGYCPVRATGFHRISPPKQRCVAAKPLLALVLSTTISWDWTFAKIAGYWESAGPIRFLDWQENCR